MKFSAVLLCLFSFVLCLPSVAQEEKPLFDELSALIEKAEKGDADAQYNLGCMYRRGDRVLEDDKEAVKWYRLAADQGYASAQFHLGCMYSIGEGVLEDDKEAVKWLRLAAEQGYAKAQLILGSKYESGEGVPQDSKEAVKWFRLAADQGLAGAKFILGSIYSNGTGVLKDDKEAVKWYRLAAEQGLAHAQFTLGRMYANGRGLLNGTGVLKDEKEAVKWYRLAAEQGYAQASYNLGLMYYSWGGDRVLEDDKEAVKWLRLAAEQGHVRAQTMLGYMYANGAGVLKDDKEAVKWYRIAAEQGNVDAQSNLGYMYRTGNGVLEDDKEAVKWYRLAADQGYAKAQYILGCMYNNGEGVFIEDDKEARKWYRLAAEQGHAQAQFILGSIYSNGEGVLQDDVAAYAWYNIAQSNGSELAKMEKARLSQRLSPEMIVHAQALSRELLKTIEANRKRDAISKNDPQSPRNPAVLGVHSQGTGFAVTREGLILTAFHVIEGARRIRITFGDGRSFSATVQSSSQSNDLALLKVDTKDLTALPMSSSRSINVGEEIFTVGYPVASLLGRVAKYTNGALSSKVGIKGEASLMQITVPIQPGNSGGPVVTSKGRVVGIVTSTAAIETFFKVTGSLPQNINWAIKAEYASLMFEANNKVADTPSLDKAIERTMKAVCLVEVWTENK